MRKPEHIPYWDRVKKILRANKISQKNFAAYIDLNFHTFKFWMIYGYYPDAKTSYEIATALGVSSDYLVTGKEMRILPSRRGKMLIKKEASRNLIKFVKKEKQKSS